MSLFLNPLKKPNAEDARLPTKQEKLRHHMYEEEIAADAYISPLVLPNERLLELKGDDSILDMSARAKIGERELSLLINTEDMEPTVSQLVSLSINYGVSIMWLLGYHTLKEAHQGGGDRELLTAVAARNSIERMRQSISTKGLLSEFFLRRAEKRLQKANLNISSVAAHIVAREHLPLDEDELCRLAGQPAFIEFPGMEGGEWGLVEDEHIHTRRGDFYFEYVADNKMAYQMPRTLVRH